MRLCALFLLALAPLAAQYQNWTIYGANVGSQRYSPLRQINASNVSRLTVNWVFQPRVEGNFEATPLFEDGILYFTGPGGHAWALDARTGRDLWHYHRPIPEKQGMCCGPLNRGFALKGDRLFLVTIDSHVEALDKKTGRLLWDTEMADYKEGYSATVAPLLVKDKIVVGIAGADMGTRGFVDAYYIDTGKRAWRFWTIPGPGEKGSETWTGEAWSRGGGSAWVTGSYDPALNLVYWGIGNPGPDLNGDVRPGANLFSDCMVALDADTGKLKWYYQFTPHDTHDWDGVNEPILADLTIHGVPRKVLLHADRNGFAYAIDRVEGKPVWGHPFVKTTWAEKLDSNGNPVVKPGTDPTKDGVEACPGLGGGKNWNHAAFNPDTGLFYVPSAEECEVFFSSDAPREAGRLWMGSVNEAIPKHKATGALRAFDARDGHLVWEFKTIRPHRGSVLTTGGDLVFAGDGQGYFTAFHARTGKVLWKLEAGAGISAPAMTYEMDGRQYIAVIAGAALFTFALPPEAAGR
ncbi:MAG TPA: PQQ-dependent dehydrogenase, methanol/ethanol family [Bryobacterales bacterium]|nr:PQQ-dependent dehydrogenase, methanol/ethanol family [Bryobacterales bacterium]